MIVAWLSRQLICSESAVSRILVERQGEYIVISQQFAGIKNFVSRFDRKNRRQIHRLHDLNVKIGTDARGSRGRVYRRCAGKREVRLVSCGTCAWRETVWRHGSSTGDSRRPWPCPQPVLLPGKLGVETTVASFGSSPTESPADETDDRPPWMTRYWGVVIPIIRLFCNFLGNFDF